jgi:hypothetical protein
VFVSFEAMRSSNDDALWQCEVMRRGNLTLANVFTSKLSVYKEHPFVIV